MVNVIRGCVGVALVGTAFAFALAGAGLLRAASQEPLQPAPAPSSHRLLVTRYCVTCHNEKTKTAGLALDRANVDRPSDNAEVWEDVIRKLRTGAMPPAGVPRPDAAGYQTLITFLEGELDRAAAGHPNPGRRAAFHRLNRAEYTNAIRDLLAVDIDAASLLPVDDAGHGFDNVADMLSVSPRLVEGYISAAARISSLALGDPAIRPFTETYDVSRRLRQEDRISDDLPFGTRGGIAVRHHFPVDGEYLLTVRLQRNKDNYVVGVAEPHDIDVRLDGARIKRFTVGGAHKGRLGVLNTFGNPNFRGEPQQEIYEFTADAGLEVRFPAKAGTRVVGVAFVEDASVPEFEVLPRQSFDEIAASGYKGGEPLLDRVTIGGPYNAAGLGTTESRRRIFVCSPNETKDEESCARQILSTLARRAYRRPATEKDLQTLLGFYRTGRTEEGFEAGIGMALERMLVSPNFLFRLERDPANAGPDTVYRLSDFELASRLSFFLWSSIPDDTLLTLAGQGRLHEPVILGQQVQRMLGDARSKALVSNFAEQWLSLRTLRTISPDSTAFPDFDDELREALHRETELLFESLLRENRSVVELLDANYTFLNERLARHYGIPDVFGSHFRRVSLGDERRRGLLGQGSILTVTSYANRTAPTLRGKWILDNVLGTPPPPPPPDVPSLKEERDGDATPRTMRERLHQHQANPGCASCHRQMDPLGFGLENFDALGRWRETDAGAPIDPTGTLPDGMQFDGPAGLRKVLLSHPQQFVQTFTEKLLTYALGRGVEFYDAPAVRTIMREADGAGYRLGALIAGIVKSDAFQMRKTRSRPS